MSAASEPLLPDKLNDIMKFYTCQLNVIIDNNPMLGLTDSKFSRKLERKRLSTKEQQRIQELKAAVRALRSVPMQIPSSLAPLSAGIPTLSLTVLRRL